METATKATGSVLDGVQAAPPFDMDAYIDEVGATPKQDYDQTWTPPVTDEPPAAPDPAQAAVDEAREGVAMRARARKRAAKFMVTGADKIQANVFTWFGAPGEQDKFRFDKNDSAEMAEYVEEILPPDFYMSPWIPLMVLFAAQIGNNVAVLQEIKAAKKREAMRIAAEALKDQRAQQERDEELQALRERREERHAQMEQQRATIAKLREELREKEAAKPAPAPEAPPTPAPTAEQPPVPAEEPPAPLAVVLCEECGKEPVRPGNRFCSVQCRGRHNGRKSQAVK